MALSQQEKVKIITDLGYAGLTVVPDSIHYSNWIDDRLSTITAEIERCIRDLLKRLQAMDEKLEKAVCRAGISQIDGIKFRDDELRILRRERRRILRELSDALEIPLMASGGAVGNVCV